MGFDDAFWAESFMSKVSPVKSLYEVPLIPCFLNNFSIFLGLHHIVFIKLIIIYKSGKAKHHAIILNMIYSMFLNW